MIFSWSTKSDPVAYSVSNPTAIPNIAHLENKIEEHPEYESYLLDCFKSVHSSPPSYVVYDLYLMSHNWFYYVHLTHKAVKNNQIYHTS